MATRGEQLYGELNSASSILALIGTPEDSHFDCKEWPIKEDDAQKMLAKAASGLTNAEGGVLVIGMKAEAKPKDEPDVVSAAAPVFDTSFIKSRLLGLIGNLVEPGIVGIVAQEVRENPGSKSGFVVVYVPKSDGPPRRSRKDWKFYQRVGSATLPMEYFQIEAMFGARPHPKLAIFLKQVEKVAVRYPESVPVRLFSLGLDNTGRGIAKFPSIRFARQLGLKIDQFGVDGNGGFGLPWRPSDPAWFVFRGGIDDVIYPDERRLIGKLFQPAIDMGMQLRGKEIKSAPWHFPAINFQCEISCEGGMTITATQSIAEDTF